MKLLGIDYGKARIGVALGMFDPAVAMPLTSVRGADPEGAAREIAELAASEGADLVVVGLPRALEGGDTGESADGARAFAELLRDAGLETAFEDERLTTAMVERVRTNAGLGTKKFDKDASAAAAILQTYIDREAGRGEREKQKDGHVS